MSSIAEHRAAAQSLLSLFDEMRGTLATLRELNDRTLTHVPQDAAGWVSTFIAQGAESIGQQVERMEAEIAASADRAGEWLSVLGS